MSAREIARRRPTTLDKLKIMVRQARCPLCSEKLGALDETEFDHAQALVNGGEDSIENLRAVHRDCHKQKTFGPGGERRVTTAGGDLHTRDKVERLEQQQADFRRTVLAKGTDAPSPAPSPKKPQHRRKPKRAFPTGRKLQSRKTDRRPSA